MYGHDLVKGCIQRDMFGHDCPVPAQWPMPMMCLMRLGGHLAHNRITGPPQPLDLHHPQGAFDLAYMSILFVPVHVHRGLFHVRFIYLAVDSDYESQTATDSVSYLLSIKGHWMDEGKLFV